jgi:phosphatidylserine decarboxylase
MEKACGHPFQEAYICDPSLKHYGFQTWDDFFTRKFRHDIRPISFPEDSSIIVSACESAPYKISYGVPLRDKFWIKGQPYSIGHILNNHRKMKHFVGGTIYQAFLSAVSYHRWHSPVDGIISDCVSVEGSYYSETLSEGFDPSGPNESQGYITEVATRALIFIKADNPEIGLMCFVGVGMAEVSSCDITVQKGKRVKKGDPIGMFHFGGSTHCLIFRPQTHLAFHLRDINDQPVNPGLDAMNIPVNKLIAKVVSIPTNIK